MCMWNHVKMWCGWRGCESSGVRNGIIPTEEVKTPTYTPCVPKYPTLAYTLAAIHWQTMHGLSFSVSLYVAVCLPT